MVFDRFSHVFGSSIPVSLSKSKSELRTALNYYNFLLVELCGTVLLYNVTNLEWMIDAVEVQLGSMQLAMLCIDDQHGI